MQLEKCDTPVINYFLIFQQEKENCLLKFNITQDRLDEDLCKDLKESPLWFYANWLGLSNSRNDAIYHLKRFKFRKDLIVKIVLD